MRSLTPRGFRDEPRADWDPNNRMTGEEKFPVIGDYLVKDIFSQVAKQFKGLLVEANCVEKNMIGERAVGFPCLLVVGSFRIWTKRMNAAYGFDFNPPYELHSWLVPKRDHNIIIDFSLPGIIIRALKFKDEKGYLVRKRKPCYLSGRPPEWLWYSPVEAYDRSAHAPH